MTFKDTGGKYDPKQSNLGEEHDFDPNGWGVDVDPNIDTTSALYQLLFVLSGLVGFFYLLTIINPTKYKRQLLTPREQPPWDGQTEGEDS